MAAFCPNCGTKVEPSARFCVNCGSEVGAPSPGGPSAGPWATAPAATMAPYGQPFGQPYGQPYGMYPFPFPYYMRPPITAGRAASIAGGVLMLIDGILAFLLGLAITLAYEEATGLLLIIGFALSVLGAISTFSCRALPLSLVGPLVLIGGGVAVMGVENDIVVAGLIGVAIAAVSLGLVASGWRDMRMREELRRNPMAFSMAQFGPPGGAPPPPYGAGPEVVKLNIRK